MASKCAQPSFLNPAVPFKGNIQGGLKDGLKITISGHVPSSGENRFHVNLQCGSSGIDVAFHFNPRFGDGVVVCNTKQTGSWGPEEKINRIPFKRGQPFEMCIQVDRVGFNVIVDGDLFTRYRHRVPIHLVDTIAVHGGVHLYNISFEAKP